jgi:ABC-type antimicrobial peptide transport system permease subunit
VVEDDPPGAAPVVVLGYSLWQTRYGGQPSVLGLTIKINDTLATVVGVMPQGMQFPANTDLWLPMSQATIVRGQSRQVRIYSVIGRLADGVTIAQAQSELSAVASRLAHDYPATNRDFVPAVVGLNERVVQWQIRLIFWSLMGAVAFVLLIACANIANLLLARAAARGKEISIRVSLGASRWRIVRQLLVESVLLASLGGILGFPLAIAGIRLRESIRLRRCATSDAKVPVQRALWQLRDLRGWLGPAPRHAGNERASRSGRADDGWTDRLDGSARGIPRRRR